MTWCAVYTQPQAEALACQQLQKQSFEVYAPVYLKERRHARKVDWLRKPLFPRYIFVKLLENSRWRSIRSTIGVSDLVFCGDKPAEVDPCIIDGIKQREDAKGLVQLPEPAGFSPGDLVRITKAGLGDLMGIFEKHDDKDRVVVLLDLLGRKVRTRANRADVHTVL